MSFEDPNADPEEVFQRLESRFGRRIRESFNASVDELRQQFTLREIADELEARGLDAAAFLLSSQGIRQAFEPVGESFQENLIEAGRERAEQISGEVRGPRGTVNFRFDPGQPQTAERLREGRLRLIREISDEQETVIRNAIADSLERGENPLQTARVFRDSVGLTQKQERAVNNFRRLLEEGEAGALQRELRDRRFDSTVRRAVRGETDLSQQQIDRMVERYRARMVKHRSEVIARTESLRALSEGREAARDQMIDEGAVRRQQFRRFWRTARDSRVRNAHEQIPRLNPDGVGPDEPFTTPLGDLRFPRDPLGSARNTIQCFVPETVVKGCFQAATKMLYDGYVVRVQTRSGRQVTVTPNHPLMTSDGLRSAGRINKGDNLVTDSFGPECAAGVAEKDRENGPATISEIFRSMTEISAPATIGVMGVDFHGDAIGGQGNVEVVNTDRELRYGAEPGICHQLENLALKMTDSGSIHRPRLCDLFFMPSRALNAARGIMRGLRVGFALGWRHVGHALVHGFRFAAPLNFSSVEDSVDDFSVNTVRASNGQNRLAAVDVPMDDVVAVEFVRYRGHVYDLQEKSGLMIAGGIVTSNCRCAIIERIDDVES